MLLSNLVLKLYRLIVLVLLGILFYCVYLSLTAVATLSFMENIYIVIFCFNLVFHIKTVIWVWNNIRGTKLHN